MTTISCSCSLQPNQFHDAGFCFSPNSATGPRLPRTKATEMIGGSNPLKQYGSHWYHPKFHGISVFTFGSLFTFGNVFISSGTSSVFTLGSRPTGPCSILIGVFTRFSERWGRGSSILWSLGSAKASAFTFFNPALVSAKGSLQAGGKGRISTEYWNPQHAVVA